ncbi:MAG TPA: Kazal-type serine protease inhibitor domain-containing protein [Chryseolinea sp.]|nr:Kazal-type serine protease inhibitor domain-containing protein [Chryseolinea sp.]
MKKLFLIGIIFCASCNDSDEPKECINPDTWGEIKACPFVIDPVCGCNNVTYDNECFAKAAGVVTWTKGVCN